MKLVTIFAFSLLEGASAWPSLSVKDDPFSTWAPAGPGDVRAPCPMLNTLANHGFLPHDGKNIDVDRMEYALSAALNFNKTLTAFIFQLALRTAPPNATTIDLDYLSRHNILEHDGSLSRLDAYFGDNHDFDQTTFDQTLAYFTSETITLQQAANARLARMYTSNATNPTFNISAIGSAFSFGETAAYILVFGDREAAKVPRNLVQYFFENERLPTSLGWSPQKDMIQEDDLLTLLNRVVNATGGQFPYPVPDGGPNNTSQPARRSVHAPF